MKKSSIIDVSLGLLAVVLLVAAGTPQYLPLTGGTMLGPLVASIFNGLPASEYKTTSANPSQLTNFWRYLHAAPVYTGNYPSAGMDIIIPNDSLWEGDVINSQAGPLGCGPNTAVPQYSQNRQAEQIRISLQSQYGYGGTGLMPVMNVMGCALVNPELYTASPTTIALTTEIGPQYLTNGSVVVMAASQVITWNGGGLPYTFARIYCADDASSNAMAVAIDGNSVGSACGTTNASPIARVFTTTPNKSYTNHTLTLTCTSGHCLLYGIEGRPSTGSGNAGVRVHNVSMGSAPSAWFAGHTEFEDLITDGVITPSAQLVIYAMGTNDAALGISVATYQSNFQTYFAHELAKAGEPPVIVIYRPGLDNIASQTYFAALTAYGTANNMLVIDQTNRWGTSCTTGCWWLGNDNVHMNDGGNLDSAHTILTALTDVSHGQPLDLTLGDTGLNPGHLWMDSPAATVSFTSPPAFGWRTVPGIPAQTGWYAFPTGTATYAGKVGLSTPSQSVPALLYNPATNEVDTATNVLDDGSGNGSMAGLFRANGGLKAGASGSTIADTRAIVNAVTFCTGGTASCTAANLQTPHQVVGSSTLSGGSITISSIPAYTSTSTFWCNANDTTSAAAVKFAAVSTTSFTLTGTGTDVVVYSCTGY